MNKQIVSVVAGGSVACVTTSDAVVRFPKVLEKFTGFTGLRPLSKFKDADPAVTTFHNFDCKQIAELADALYEMRIIRIKDRAQNFKLLYREKTPSRALPSSANLAVFKFADRLLAVIEKFAVQGRFTSQNKFFLRFVICKPIGGKLR